MKYQRLDRSKFNNQNIIDYLNPDIVYIYETHSQNDQSIIIEGYECLLYNRTVRHKDAHKIFGGIGTFVQDNLFNKYDINIIDKSIDGILGLLF